MSVEEKITKARARLVISQPFFGLLVLRLKPEESRHYPTAATDGRSFFYSKDWLESLELEHVKAVLCHEVLHCGLGHLLRREDKNPVLWNVATDFAVNAILVQEGFELPGECLYEKRFENKSAEEIYQLLLQNVKKYEGLKTLDVHLSSASGDGQNKQRSEQSGSGKQCDGSSKQGGQEQDGDRSEQRCKDVFDSSLHEEWKDAFAQVAEVVKKQGRLPSGLERFIGTLLRPRLPWTSLLRRYVSEAVTRSDYTWYPVNRKYLPYYVPSVRKGERLEIVVAIDTSGSISNDELLRFLSELHGILSTFQEYKVWVYDCDAKVHNVVLLETGDDIRKVKPKGGGGTSFVPVFDDVRKRRLTPRVLVYFTDTLGDFPSKPTYDVIWVVVGNQDAKVPFGRIVRV